MQHLFLAASLLLLSGSATPHQDEAWLKEQRQKMAQSPEEPVYEGARACAAEGAAAAVELLISTLGVTANRGLPAPHYRDIAWDSLVQVETQEGRALVAETLADAKDPMVREWCADLLGLYGDEAYGEVLVKALKDREDAVPRAAARALERLAYAPAAPALLKLVRDKDPRTRANAIGALAAIDMEAHGELLLDGLADKEPEVRCALLGLVPHCFEDREEELSTAALADEDWRPRIQAIRNLGNIRTKTAIDALLTATSDDRQSLVLEAILMLAGHTGMKFRKPELWQRWWDDNRETFEFPTSTGGTELEGDETVATYNGIRVDSDNVAFLIDVSSWMERELVKRGERRIDVATSELDAAFQLLQPPFNFNVYLYAEDLEPLSKKPLALSKVSLKKALKFVDKAGASGSKDIWNALYTTITNGTYDAIYLLSSGEPDVGWVVHPEHLNYHLAELIRFHPVKVHTIAYTDEAGFQAQLDRIARTTGGDTRHVE